MPTCKDCLQNCGQILSDQCVQYTGPSIPVLGICQGDQLSQWEADIVNALLSALDGSGITPESVTVENCPFVMTQLGALPPNLNNLLQVLINGQCTLKALIDQINVVINSLQQGVVIDIACLEGLPANPTQPQILQSVIFALCDLSTTVDSFSSTYVKLTDLTTLVTPIVISVINNSQQNQGVAQQNAKMVPNVAYEYYGSLSNFDSNGIGITSLGWARVFLCNGANGTPDKRGRVAVGAIRNVPGGGALDPAVDPAVNPNNPNWALNDKAGETYHTLTLPEVPPHTHGVTDAGHSHTYGSPIGDNLDRGNDDGCKLTALQTLTTGKAFTGITLQNAGGGQPHLNIQPSIAANFIMYLP